jgi:CheY-like chemotaxis protein
MVTSYDWSNKHIVIADDDDLNFELLKLILKQTNADIIHLKNGQEVIDYVDKKHSIDLILMDIQMPVLDGMKATQLLRKQGFTSGIFALTALSVGSNTGFAHIGFDEIIEKPIRRGPFLKLIHDHFTVKG